MPESAELLTKEWLAKPLSRMIGTNGYSLTEKRAPTPVKEKV
jgi:hypothetical protein